VEIELHHNHHGILKQDSVYKTEERQYYFTTEMSNQAHPRVKIECIKSSIEFE
jgi:hypothetical protein